jgi:hypothetical protein
LSDFLSSQRTEYAVRNPNSDVTAQRVPLIGRLKLTKVIPFRWSAECNS